MRLVCLCFGQTQEVASALDCQYVGPLVLKFLKDMIECGDELNQCSCGVGWGGLPCFFSTSPSFPELVNVRQ